jgi:Leucine-rich repeat (LRR) protein
MKKNDWILLASVATYSYLFYDQSAGINWLVFNAVLIILLLSRNKEVYKTRNWILAATGCTISAICIAYYGNGLSIIANIISLGMLSAYSINSKTSVIISFVFSCYSVAASAVFMIIDSITRNKNKSELTEAKPVSVKLMLYLVPLLIALVFFFMYKAANPVFDNYTKKINLDFITISWFFFTLGGLFLMYGFFYHKTIKSLEQKDQNAPDSLYPEMIDNTSTLKRFLTIDNEKLSGVILFLLLNTLLLSVNIIDVHFLWFDGVLPKELSYSAFVHQGTGALISSIIIAILIILYYFRGELNFHSGNKLLKVLACLWVIQNAFMIISTAYRNNLYINEYSLTYKRIGVYVWLLLVLIGLITTFIKIIKAKSNWYLFRTNGWMFYSVLLASCFINWDVIVSDFNIQQSAQKHKALDVVYLTNLSEKNIPQLLSLHDSTKAAVIDEYNNENNLQYNYSAAYYKPQLHYKLYCFLDEMQQHQWQSYCIEKVRVLREIEAMKKNITEFNLENYYKTSLKPLATLEYLTNLNFSNNLLTDFNDLRLFPLLETLYLNSNSLDSIKVFPVMKNLGSLALAYNRISDVSILKSAPNLTSLDLSGNLSLDLKTLPPFKQLNTLSFNSNSITDLKPLLGIPELKELNMAGNPINKSIEFPAIPKLEILNLQNTQLSSNDMYFFQGMKNLNNLSKLDLSDNRIETLYGVLTYTHIKKSAEINEQFLPMFDHLKSLNLARNNLTYISLLMLYPNLEELYVDSNVLKDVSKLNQLTQLKVLSISNCGVRNIEFLKSLEQLETLDMSSNSISDFSPLYNLKHLKQLNIGAASKQMIEQLKKKLPGTNVIGY